MKRKDIKVYVREKKGFYYNLYTNQFDQSEAV